MGSDNRIFPFEREEGNGILPVGNQPLVRRNIGLLKEQGIQQIYVMGKKSASLERISSQESCRFLEIREHVFAQIADLDLKNRVLIMYGDLYLEADDIRALAHGMEEDKARVLGRPWRERESGFGARCREDHVEEIYGYPRDHYVDTRIFGACILPGKWLETLRYTEKGAARINCGQMPDRNYHLENALEELIRSGMELDIVMCRKPAVQICFPWDLAEANHNCCYSVKDPGKNVIGDGSTVEQIRQKSGHLRVGKNCRIRGVTFEGNCVIGDNVILEDGAVIGENCIIGDDTVIRYQCMIHSGTVIGQKNKVGFGAEICGVTMEGVAAVHGCEIFGVIGRYVDIAAGVVMAVLRFDDAYVPRKVNGKVYATPYTNNICIGDYTRTGVHNTFLPGVSVGNRCAIGPGVLVEENVPHGTLLLLKQETVKKEWGSGRYGW